jgi:hypothetical protein
MRYRLNAVQLVTEILCLTLYRAIAKYRRERGANVLRVLAQHNVFYFVCGVGKFVYYSFIISGTKGNAFIGSSVVLIVSIAIFPVST